MGTRADFYIGRGASAEWLGSIAWDGYEIPPEISQSTDREVFRSSVKEFLESREDGTLPERDGWPWPWETSATTDYAYAFDGDRVYYCVFDRPWHLIGEEDNLDEEEKSNHEWPLRGGHPQGDIWGPRSGVLVFGIKNE